MKTIIGYCYNCDRAALFSVYKNKAECKSCKFLINEFSGIRISMEIKALCPEERRKIWESFSEEMRREGKSGGAEGR